MLMKKMAVLSVAIGLAGQAVAMINAGSQSLGNNGCAYSCWEGTDSHVVFFAHDTNNVNGSYFANLTALSGVRVDDIVAGRSFRSIVGPDISLYDSWGIFATSNDLETTYSYGRAGIALGGIVGVSDFSTPTGPIGSSESATDVTKSF